MNNTLSATQVFIIFALEAFQKSENIKAMEAYTIFVENNIFSYLSEGYDVLHTQSLAYVVSDIKSLIHN